MTMSAIAGAIDPVRIGYELGLGETDFSRLRIQEVTA
jgi:hypothetical protein